MKGIQYAFLAGIIIVVLIILVVFGFLQPVAGLDLLSLLNLQLATNPTDPTNPTSTTSTNPSEDINGDGKPDIAILRIPTNPNSINWYIGQNLGGSLAFTLSPEQSTSVKDIPAGSGVAIADISGDSISDLVIMEIVDGGILADDYIVYKVCFGLDINGKTGKCTDWLPKTGSPSLGRCTSFGGVAVSDINGNGKQDIVVMGLDQGGLCNGDPDHWWYFVGWDLDPITGEQTAAWSSRKQVPNTPGDTARGADLALADLDKNGKLEIILMTFDLDKSFRWVIGKDLNSAGDPANGWVPSTGFSLRSSGVSSIATCPIARQIRDSAGAGVTFRDIDGNGFPDMIFLFLNTPAAFVAGMNLNIAGTTTGWVPLNGVLTKTIFSSGCASSGGLG